MPSIPTIGITPDMALHPTTGEPRYVLSPAYAAAVIRAGGLPVILPAERGCINLYLDHVDAIILTGGDDPATEQWGVITHEKAMPIDGTRQAFETDLLVALDQRPLMPVLGICLGMQLMALHAGGRLNQHLPDDWPTAADHWDHQEHRVEFALPGARTARGFVHSHHRQAVDQPGTLRVIGRAHDDLIEAIAAPPDDERAFYIGVQWHPERTGDERFGSAIFKQLIRAAMPLAEDRTSDMDWNLE